MKNINLLPIPEDARKRLSDFAAQYRRMDRIYIEIESFNNGRLIVRAEQKVLINDKILTKKELTDRVREMFAGEIPADWKLTVSAVNYDRRDIAGISPEWIMENMTRLNLKSKDIVSHTGLDKSTISSLLSGDKELTKWHKIAFYYLFKFLEFVEFDK